MVKSGSRCDAVKAVEQRGEHLLGQHRSLVDNDGVVAAVFLRLLPDAVAEFLVPATRRPQVLRQGQGTLTNLVTTPICWKTSGPRTTVRAWPATRSPRCAGLRSLACTARPSV
jgi:hypothetical protein